MSTWVTVILKYITDGMAFGVTTAETTVLGQVVPGLSWKWVIAFDATAATALLTVVFGLYFGNKFSPASKENTNGNSVQENPAITK